MDESKIDVVYQGGDDIFKQSCSPAQVEGILQRYSLTSEYLLQVGSIEERKNAMLSVQALASVPGCELILIGRETAYLKRVLSEAERLGVRERVRILHDVPFHDLSLLYRGASAALYPSRYEGFGLPVLEALTCGVPCVAATGSCLEEAGGRAALYVNPDNPRELAAAVNTLLTDKQLRGNRIQEGLRHAAKFSNADVAANTRDVYVHAIADWWRHSQ